MNQEHCDNVLRAKKPLLATVLDSDQRLFICTSYDLGRPQPHVPLDPGVLELEAYQALGCKDGVLQINICLFLGSFSNEHASLREGNARRGR
mmetsp:Transcript_3538/g.8304  ORF Transcript_3538/g.8304 Transcript_3538/m.8304 type:complete len:92 (+) Transcript_3538:1286-1561(+)